jgi:hypothetical protein
MIPLLRTGRSFPIKFTQTVALKSNLPAPECLWASGKIYIVFAGAGERQEPGFDLLPRSRLAAQHRSGVKTPA